MAIFNVTNATQLQSALGSAVGGDRIVLAAGDYGTVSVNNRQFASTVSIEAQGAAGSVRLDGLKIANSKNISVVGLDLGHALGPNEPDYTQLNSIQNSTNIQFSRVSIHGSLDGNPLNDGVGLALTNVTGFKLTDSSFAELWRGIAIVRSSNVSLQKNEFELIRSDGAVVTASDGVVFEENLFSDFRPSAELGDHADAIQFWNTGQTKGSTNITIKNNVIMPGYFSGVAGSGVQGIFISDPMTFGYKNILIQNNLIYSNGAYHGINVNGGTGVQIIGNTAISSSSDAMRLWIRAGDSSNVVIRDNVVDDLILQNSTSVFLADNINFAVTPGARAQIANLLNPRDAADLILSDAGYQHQTAPLASPVSDAAGSLFGSLLSQSNSASLSSLLAELAPSPAIDLGGLSNAIVDVRVAEEDQVISDPVAAFSTAAWHAVPAMAALNLEHFAALP